MATESGSSKKADRGVVLAICVFLIAITWIVFGQTIHYPFINYDDPAYILERPEINRGLTWSGIIWSLTHAHGGNWHPLTSISHMLDCQMFGAQAGGHHFVNILLHSISVVLLFLVLQQMTGSPGSPGDESVRLADRTGNIWPSALVAVIFAIHPLRVESAVWIAERKDVLSGVFFMLTLAAYFRYTRRPSASRYITMSILYALGLMSKPMLVTLPFALLLLDYWPLRRIRSPATFQRLVVEKIPILALSVASSIATTFAQTGSISSLERLPLADRVANALVSYVVYIRQTFWPTHLAVIYPFRQNLPVWEVVGAALFLLAASFFAWRLRETRAYFFTGWFWFMGMLLPVIGIVQVGLQAHADRYTYLPQIGLFILVVWGVAEFTKQLRYQKQIITVAIVLMLIALASTTWAQLSYWRDSETLWSRTIDITTDNDIAHAHIADLLLRRGRIDESISHSLEAIKIKPNNADAQNNLGLAYLQLGNEREAAIHLEESLKADARNLNARVNLAWILSTSADPSRRDGVRAVELADSVARGLGRDNPTVLRTLAAAYAEAGQFAEAIETAQQALEIANATGNTGLATDLERNIASYRLNRPLRSKMP